MFYYKCKIQYDGTGYAGFQWQNGLKTIQDEINQSLSQICTGKMTTVGASRTDSGVHACDQIIKISATNQIDFDQFCERFNSVLPAQINCLSIETCNGDFKPSSHAAFKEYRYYFTNRSIVTYVDRRFVANISAPLNFEKIQLCLDELVGEHDFCNFHSRGSNVKNTVRNIYSCDLSQVNPHHIFSPYPHFRFPDELESCFQLKVVANGFLKQMIRHIVSALWMVGSGKLTPDEFKQLLYGPKSPKQNWKVGSAQGLFLFRIDFR